MAGDKLHWGDKIHWPTSKIPSFHKTSLSFNYRLAVIYKLVTLDIFHNHNPLNLDSSD